MTYRNGFFRCSVRRAFPHAFHFSPWSMLSWRSTWALTLVIVLRLPWFPQRWRLICSRRCRHPCKSCLIWQCPNSFWTRQTAVSQSEYICTLYNRLRARSIANSSPAKLCCSHPDTISDWVPMLTHLHGLTSTHAAAAMERLGMSFKYADPSVKTKCSHSSLPGIVSNTF